MSVAPVWLISALVALEPTAPSGSCRRAFTA